MSLHSTTTTILLLLTSSCLVNNVKGFSINNNNIRLVARNHNIKEFNNVLPAENRRSTTTALSSLPVVTTASSTIIPLSAAAIASLVPSLLGYYKTEYGVSYAYGTAVASIAWLVLQRLPSYGSIAAIHAASLLVYGIRLNLFLLYRELFLPKFRKFREKIEDKSKSKGGRPSRTPFILGVAMLYFCLGIPIITTASSSSLSLTTIPFWSIDTVLFSKLNIVRFLIGTTWFGFVLAMIGDTTKSYMKAKEGEDHLVTGGIFCFLRHPNYTGEILGWTSNAVLSLLLGKPQFAVASIFGAMGINFVLLQATASLERKQKEKYGDDEKYQTWIQRSWGGFTIHSKQKPEEGVESA